MVYCAGSLALAALEVWVHLNASELPDDFVAIAIDIPEDVTIEDVGSSQLPLDWSVIPGPQSLRDIGSAWIARNEGAVLSVPSAVISQERNFLLNPNHGDFEKIVPASIEAFRFDPRMLKPSAGAAKPKRKLAAKKSPRKSVRRDKDTPNDGSK